MIADLVIVVAVTAPETVFAEAAEEERTAGGSIEHHLSEYLALASVEDDQHRELKQRLRGQKDGCLAAAVDLGFLGLVEAVVRSKTN